MVARANKTEVTLSMVMSALARQDLWEEHVLSTWPVAADLVRMAELVSQTALLISVGAGQDIQAHTASLLRHVLPVHARMADRAMNYPQHTSVFVHMELLGHFVKPESKMHVAAIHV